MRENLQTTNAYYSFTKLLATALVGAAFLCLPTRAQDTNATALPAVIVTGSLIPTAETIGSAPLQTVSAAEIQKVGAQDILELVKKVSPVFGGNGNTGQEVNNGGFGESYIAIRNLQTLVLLNGRRLGNSAFSNGGLVDVNSIPLAAVERVEILRDGASALYGSEAVGGVVNIITKKNFSEIEVSGRYGFATGDGEFTEQRATLVGGLATDKASFTAAMQYYNRDPLKTTDRDIASMGAAELEANNIYYPAVSYMSPSYPGKVQDSTGAYVLRSNPLLKEFSPEDYNPNAPTSPPRIPNGSGGYLSFTGPTAVRDYNNDPYWGTPAGQAALGGAASPFISDPGMVLNTTLFGTHTIQSQTRNNFFGSGQYDLYEKKMTLFSDFLFAHIESQGQLAPSPVVGLGPKQSNIDIPANNIYNPFQIALGPTAGLAGLPPGGPRVRSRFVDSGNREFDSQSDYYHIVAGLKGEFEGGWGYNAAYNYNRYDQQQTTKNAINGAALDLALKPNSNPTLAAQGLSQLLGPTGPVPMYNIFGVPAGSIYSGPLVNDATTIDTIRTSLFQDGTSEEWDAGGVITGSPLELPWGSGKVSFAVGGNYGSESLSTDYDGLTRIGKVPGLNASAPTSGTRDNYATFIEVRIPFTSPDMEIPGLRSLEVTAAGRYENFDPGGDEAVPKVSARWQPLDDQVTIRGSYAQSFVAPTTYQLFGGDQVSVPLLGVPATGDPTIPPDEYSGLQEYTTWQSNPDLTPADAYSWSVGIVLSPKFIKGLTVSVDYYHIRYENSVFRIDEQTMVDSINANGVNSPYANYFYRADGTQIQTDVANQANDADWGNLYVPLENGAKIITDGFDIGGNYQLETDKYGVFNFYANANVLLSYEYSDPIAGGPYKYAGQYSDPNTIAPGGQGTIPWYQINTGMSWDICDFTYSINARYIPETDAWGSENFTADESKWTVDSWYSIDMQLAYRFGENYGTWLKGTRLAVGCNNVTDNDPPLIASAFEDNTDKSTYDIIGRFVYFEISKKF